LERPPCLAQSPKPALLRIAAFRNWVPSNQRARFVQAVADEYGPDAGRSEFYEKGSLT